MTHTKEGFKASFLKPPESNATKRYALKSKLYLALYF